MASSSNSSKQKSCPQFLYSGVNKNEDIKQYFEMIISLGGKVLSLREDQFLNSCTHVLCFLFEATAMIMGGLASGKNEYFITNICINFS